MIEQTFPTHIYDDWRWARRTPELYERYQGQLIAVNQKQVIAHGFDREQLLRQIADQGFAREEVVIVAVFSQGFEETPDQV